jgi:hypothetical protein
VVQPRNRNINPLSLPPKNKFAFRLNFYYICYIGNAFGVSRRETPKARMFAADSCLQTGNPLA